jgi:hypothetical protein
VLCLRQRIGFLFLVRRPHHHRWLLRFRPRQQLQDSQRSVEDQSTNQHLLRHKQPILESNQYKQVEPIDDWFLFENLMHYRLSSSHLDSPSGYSYPTSPRNQSA